MSLLASKSMLTYPRGSTSNLSPWMVLPRHSTVHIASAMVKLVGFHHFITFRGVRTGFLWFSACFSSFLHDFCVQYLRRTNFSRATRFLVDLPAHGGAVGFFISGFVATALIWAPFSGGSSHDSTISRQNGYPRFWVVPRNFCASSFKLTPSCVALAA